MRIVELEHGRATATVHTLGATVLSYDPGGGDRLWVSERASFVPGKAIRGGIPVCWPWFANAGTPSHGLARTRVWAVQQHDADSVRLTLQHDESTLALWPHPFRLELDVRLAGDHLRAALTHHNLDASPVACSGALHSYLRAHTASAEVLGLEGARRSDKVDGSEGVQRGPVTFTGELDQVFRGVPGPVRLGGVEVRSSTDEFVVWNPGADKGATMADVSDPGAFVCVEAAQFSTVHVPAGGRYTLWTELRRVA